MKSWGHIYSVVLRWTEYGQHYIYATFVACLHP